MMARNRIASLAMGAVMFSVVTARTMRAQQKSSQGTAGNTVVTQPDERNDPNLPGPMSPAGGVTTPSGVRIEWSETDPAHPQVIFAAPGGVRTSHPAQYLGWNDQGSYLRNRDDGQVYVWNLSKGSLTKIGPEIPPEIFASLKNNSVNASLAAAKNPPPPKPIPPEPQTPDTSRQAAFFGGSGNLTQAAATGAITGSGAAVQGGVLTFTRADNTKASYKVVRPKVAQGAPGSTGTWIAMEDAGKGILFTVQGDGTLTGHEMPAQLIQMLTQAPAR